MWSDFHPIAKLTFGIMGTNGVVHLITAAAPKYKELLAHTPAFNRRWTLVTSNFVHFGFWHIALNTWACYNFLIPAGYSPLFQGDPYHLLAFFLSTGTIASYGQHLATLPTSPMSMQTLVRSGGASGALFGAFAVFCMQYPNAQVGIVLVPFSVAAINMLPAAMAFDLWGAVRGFKFTKMGHAVSFPSCDHRAWLTQ
jgi:rhomboid-like protein